MYYDLNWHLEFLDLTELLSEDVSQTRQSFICPQVYYKAKRHIGGFAKGLMYYTVM